MTLLKPLSRSRSVPSAHIQTSTVISLANGTPENLHTCQTPDKHRQTQLPSVSRGRESGKNIERHRKRVTGYTLGTIQIFLPLPPPMVLRCSCMRLPIEEKPFPEASSGCFGRSVHFGGHSGLDLDDARAFPVKHHTEVAIDDVAVGQEQLGRRVESPPWQMVRVHVRLEECHSNLQLLLAARHIKSNLCRGLPASGRPTTRLSSRTSATGTVHAIMNSHRKVNWSLIPSVGRRTH